MPPVALTALQAAYLENPRDVVSAAHIGWVRIWRLRAALAGPSAGPLGQEFMVNGVAAAARLCPIRNATQEMTYLRIELLPIRGNCG